MSKHDHLFDEEHIEPQPQNDGEKKFNGNGADGEAEDGLGEWDAGDDLELPPPRGWLLGNIFAREFLSCLLADGGVGKTATRYVEFISLASDKELTGEHIFQRCRVLVLSFEDGSKELRRRIRAAMKHHNVSHADVKGWLFLAALGRKDGKIMEYNSDGRPVAGRLIEKIERVIVKRQIDLVALDPFVKTHGLEENSNTAMDQVAQALTDLATKHNIAVDLSHHTRKGTAEPGNADSGRGASATKDAGRLVYSLTRMTSEEAQLFGISEEQRPFYLRMDNAKVNILPPSTAAKWFRLVSVPLGNCTALYPNGDDVQTVERWTPPSIWRTSVSSPSTGFSTTLMPVCPTVTATAPPAVQRTAPHGRWW